MISAFLLRADALTPSASAMAISWPLSFDSSTDCSSACAVTMTFFLRMSLWGGMTGVGTTGSINEAAGAGDA